MITGEVTADREAIIKLTMRGPTGVEAEIEAALDTGFTEYLTLPSTLINGLGLPYQYSLSLAQADGVSIWVRVYHVVVLWDGQERAVPAHSIDSDPLVGMSLLYGSRLLLDAVDGGQVTIGPIP
jgi:clan AA aspartic protease